MTDRKIRRNDIVRVKKDGWFYGRVWKRLDDNHVRVICCGKHVTDYADDELEVHNDYKGFWSENAGHPVFRRMLTLKQLKEHASGYHPEVWRKSKQPKEKNRRKWIDADRVYAPWSDRQVELIRLFQKDGRWAPETCGNHYSRNGYDEGDTEEQEELVRAHEDYRDRAGNVQKEFVGPAEYHLVHNARFGGMQWERKDTPYSCSVASEGYWQN